MAQMKIIVIALGSDGDINPMIEISLVLKARGHEVEF
jgi:UDP:flavonoid glycosyltransferase YjiC (YdhE family)